MFRAFQLIAIIITTAVLVNTDESVAEKPLFSVAVIVPQTGPLNMVGIPLRNALLLADEQLDKGKQIELLFDDDSSLPRNTVAAVKRFLLSDKKPDAFVVFGTSPGMAVASTIENAGIPFLSLNVNRTVIAGHSQSFLMMPSVEQLTAENILEVKAKHYKRIAVIASVQDSTLLQKKIFIDSGVAEIVHEEEINIGDTDTRGPTLRTLAEKPDAVFLSTIPPHGSLFARRLKELGFRGELFGGIQLSYEAEANQGIGLGDVWVVGGNGQKGDSYYRDYKNKFNEDASAESIFAYDTFDLLLNGLATGNLNGFLHAVKDFHGKIGVFSADGNGGFSFPVVVKKYSNGKLSSEK